MTSKLRPIEAQLEALEAQLGLIHRGAVDPTGDGGMGLPEPVETLRDDDPVASCVCALHGRAREQERFRG